MLTPTVLKGLGILLLLGGVFGAGWWRGYSGEHDKLTTYTVQVTQQGKDQAAQTLLKDMQNEEATRSIAQTWKTDHDRLVANNDWLRNHPNGSGPMPQTIDGQPGNADVVAIEGGTCTRTFYFKALDAEQLLEAWQAWAVAHSIH
jgi:hypothetical protein